MQYFDADAGGNLMSLGLGVDRHDGYFRPADRPLGRAPQEESVDAGPPVGPHRDQVDFRLVSVVEQSRTGEALTDLRDDLDPGVAGALGDAVGRLDALLAELVQQVHGRPSRRTGCDGADVHDREDVQCRVVGVRDGDRVVDSRLGVLAPVGRDQYLLVVDDRRQVGRPHGHDGDVCAPDDVFGDTPRDETAQPSSTARAHRDHVDPLVLDVLDDGVTGFSPDDATLQRDVRVGEFLDSGDSGLGLLAQAVDERAVDAPGVERSRCGGDVDDADDVDRRVEALGESQSVAGGQFRVLAPVGRYQYRIVHSVVFTAGAFQYRVAEQSGAGPVEYTNLISTAAAGEHATMTTDTLDRGTAKAARGRVPAVSNA